MLKIRLQGTLRDIQWFRRILENHKSNDDKWVVDAMQRHINDKDTEPFLLINKGKQVE